MLMQIQCFSFNLEGRRQDKALSEDKMETANSSRKRDTIRRRDGVGQRRVDIKEVKGRGQRQLG
jgi:hypothetical protein